MDWAAAGGYFALVEYLVQLGMDVNERGGVRTRACVVGPNQILLSLSVASQERSSTALAGAACNGHLAVVEHLVENNAGVKAADEVRQ